MEKIEEETVEDGENQEEEMYQEHIDRAKKKKKKHKAKKQKNDDDERKSTPESPKPPNKSKLDEKAAPKDPPPLPAGSHPFEVDDSDHCETPLRAYQDLAIVLDQLLSDGNNANLKPRSSLRIYDPYYCDGGVKTKLAGMGFTSVINENRDFYKDIASNKIPEYDVLVTNPPYSGEHMEKLLDFCVGQKQPKPCFLLLPHFVYTKDYYSRALSPLQAAFKNSFFSFLVPSVRYSYVPPTWVADRSGAAKALSKGKDTTAPFPSFWYCCHLQDRIEKAWFEKMFGASGSIRSRHSSGLRYSKNTVAIPRDFKGEFDPTKKRPNPKARKRLRMAAAGGGAFQDRLKKKQKQEKQRDAKKKKKKRY